MRLIDADALMKDICDSLDQMTDIGIAVDGDWLWAKLNDAIDNAPTIEPEPQWIPCSERLPSKADHIDNMVLACYGNGSVRFNTYMNGWVQGNPVAWMPLPEPYKEEQE